MKELAEGVERYRMTKTEAMALLAQEAMKADGMESYLERRNHILALVNSIRCVP